MIKKILIPTDFSASAQYALQYAVGLNKLFDARLYLLHVLQDFTEFSEFNLNFNILPQLYDEFEGNAAKRLEDVASTLIPSGTTCDTYIVHGIPFNEIINFAKKEQIDLIVIDTRGRTGLKHILVGSTAEKVVKRSLCPVLSVRNPEFDS